MTTPAERLEQAIEQSAAALADGLDLSDLPTLIRNGVEVAESMDDLSGAEKERMVERYVAELIGFALDDSDQLAKWVADLDIPYVPEGLEVAVVDPLIRKALPPVLRPMLMALVPGIVKLVIDASRGGVQVNMALWVKAGQVIQLLQLHGPTILKAISHAQAVADNRGIDAGDPDNPTAADLFDALEAVRELLT